MADKEEKLVKLFGSTSRARILDFLCRHSGESYYQREIMHETGLSLQAVQRELGILAELEMSERGRTKLSIGNRRRKCRKVVVLGG